MSRWRAHVHLAGVQRLDAWTRYGRLSLRLERLAGGGWELGVYSYRDQLRRVDLQTFASEARAKAYCRERWGVADAQVAAEAKAS